MLSFIIQNYFQVKLSSSIIIVSNNIFRRKTFLVELMYVTKEIQNKFHKQKNYLHQRSIFREMMSTCDKLGNSFLTKEQTKKFQFMETKQKQDAKLSNSHKQRPRQRWSHQPNNHYCRKDDGQVFVKQSKQIKQIKDLRAKMLPKVSKSNFQKKLKQIIYIKNMGQKKRKNSNISSFIKKTEETDQENILKQAWDSLQKTRIDSTTISDFRKSKYFFGKSKFSSSYASQKSTPFLLSKQSSTLDVQDFIQGFQRATKHNLTIADNLKNYESDQIDISSRTNKIRTDINSKQSLKLNYSKNNFQKKYMSQKVSFYRPPLKILDELGIQKNIIKEQNAHNLYNLIKGGYSLDTVEVQGQYISLKGFKQAKQNFKMLKQCYKAAKEHRYLSKNLQNELKGESFKTLVYLCQLSGKIAPSQLHNLMKYNKIVQ